MPLPQRMNEMMPQVVDAFRTFVDELMVGGETASGALSRLVEKLADVLFGGESGAVLTALANGFHALADLVVSNIINLVPYILEGL